MRSCAFSFLADRALRVELADVAAFAAGCRIDHGVDQSGFAAVHGLVHGAAQLVGRCDMDANAAERFHQFLVAGIFDEDGCRNVRTAGRVHVGSAVDAIVVEDDNADRQVVPADRFHLHAGETKGAVPLDCEHGFARLDCGGDGKTHADAHDPPGADIRAACAVGTCR